jgi:hypothetical protein
LNEAFHGNDVEARAKTINDVVKEVTILSYCFTSVSTSSPSSSGFMTNWKIILPMDNIFPVGHEFREETGGCCNRGEAVSKYSTIFCHIIISSTL